MPDPPKGEITIILGAVREGSPGAIQDLVNLIYEELRRMARQQNANVPVQSLYRTTALVHEAYLRLLRDQAPTWQDRREFFRAASRAMHDILVEEARRCDTKKRGAGRKRIELSDDLTVYSESRELLDLSEAIARLEKASPDSAEVVMLRFFGGLTHDVCAQVLDVSEATVRRRWTFARAWLHRAMSEDGLAGPPSDIPKQI